MSSESDAVYRYEFRRQGETLREGSFRAQGSSEIWARVQELAETAHEDPAGLRIRVTDRSGQIVISIGVAALPARGNGPS